MNSHLRAALLAACLTTALCSAKSLHAQSNTYKRSATDTLRYREVTLGNTSVTTPQGPVQLNTKQDATIGLVLGASESARAWYEALTIESSSPQGVKKPSTTDLLRQPYTLNVDARGRLTVLGTPTFSAEVKAVTDLRHQFDDFLLRLPAQPLVRNLEWTDTRTVGNTEPTGRYSQLTTVVRYRVLSDTTVNAVRGVVVMMVQDVSLEAGGPVEGQPLKAASVMSGTDSGSVVFSISEGRMLARERHGDLNGTLTYTGGAAPITLQQRYQYQSVITLQKP